MREAANTGGRRLRQRKIKRKWRRRRWSCKINLQLAEAKHD
jgi:hypothetical protein